MNLYVTRFFSLPHNWRYACFFLLTSMLSAMVIYFTLGSQITTKKHLIKTVVLEKLAYERQLSLLPKNPVFLELQKENKKKRELLNTYLIEEEQQNFNEKFDKNLFFQPLTFPDKNEKEMTKKSLLNFLLHGDKEIIEIWKKENNKIDFIIQLSFSQLIALFNYLSKYFPPVIINHFSVKSIENNFLQAHFVLEVINENENR